MNIVERKGDQYRVWSTVSDSYCDAPMSRGEMAEEMARWGFSQMNIKRRLDEATVVEEWAMSALEQDAELLGCDPDEVVYFGDSMRRKP